jgi:DNA adenine methylase
MLPPRECYVEVFAGAAWVLLGKEPSKVEILNDIDGEVVNFFRVVKEKPSVNDSGHGNRLIGSLKNLHERILPAYNRLQTVIIEKLDWRGCVDRYDKEEATMFLDPPYPANNVNYQHNLRAWKSHEVIAERMKRAKAKCLLTTYDLPELRELSGYFNITPVRFPAGMPGSNGRQNREIIVTNYEVK